MKKQALTCLLVAGLTLAGCENSNMGQKQAMGTGVGALAGGLAGSQIGKGSGRLWGTGAGVLLGALLGSELGSSLDQQDHNYMQQAQYRAYDAPVGQPIYWNNPQNGNNGYYIPVRDGRTASGAYCREYEQTVIVGGQRQNGYGTACQQPDGTWQIVS